MKHRSASVVTEHPMLNPKFTRTVSHDSTLYTARSVNADRKNSFCVSSNAFCRQSTICSTHSDDARPIDQTVKVKGKMIKSARDLMILIGMALIEFSGTCALSIIAPFFTPEAESKGVSQSLVGLIFAVYPLFIFIFSPLVGKWIPKLGVKFCLIGGCFLEGGTLILFGFVDSLPSGWIYIFFCFLIRTVTAIGSAMSQTASLSILTVTFKDHIGAVFGITETFTGLGFMTGPALGGVLYQHGGFRMPFFVCGGLVLLDLIIVWFILPPEEAYHRNEVGQGDEELTSIIQTIRIPGIAAVGICIVTAGIGLSFLDPTLTPYLQKIKPGISTEQIGLIFMSIAGTFTIMAPFIGYLVDKGFRGRYFMIFGQFGVFFGFFLMGPSPIIQPYLKPAIWLVIVSGVLIGLVFGWFVVPILGDMQNSARNGGLPMTLGTDGVLSGIFNGCFSIGSVIGPTAGGLLSHYWSFEGACTIFAFTLMGEGVLLFFFTIWESKSKWGPKNVHGFRRLQEEC